jgi:predicted nuclease of predicted toxin-antitoxin system
MKPKIVADESVDFRIVTALRNIKLDVYAICEENRSVTDEVVLSIATDQDALLITEDKDFGELVFRLRLPHKGILLVRIEDEKTKVSRIVETISKNYDELYGRFSVINDNKLRIKE